MATYANGLETKGVIVETCKRLFIEKGYKNTTYAEIYKVAMVNPGTIAHHFGNKRNIASMLYMGFMQQFMASVDELFGDEDDLQKAFIGLALHRKLAYVDENYRRFVMEFMLDDLANDDEARYMVNDYEVYRTTAEAIGTHRATFFFVAYKGIEAAVDAFYGRHPERATYEEMFSNYAHMYFCYLPPDEVEERTARALELVEAVEVSLVDYEVRAALRG